MDNIIKKIVLDLGKNQVELTPEQCRKLKDALDEMFGKEIVKEIHHRDYPHLRFWPYWDTSLTYPNTVSYSRVVWSSDSGCQVSYADSTMTMKVA